MEILLEELFRAVDRIVPTLEVRNHELITIRWHNGVVQAYPLMEPNIVAWEKTSLPTEDIQIAICWKLLSGLPRMGKGYIQEDNSTRTLKLTTSELTKIIDYCDDASEPPEFETTIGTADIIHAENLIDALKRCMLICKDEAREAISGLCISDIHGIPCMVSTDGARITVARLKTLAATSTSPETVIPFGMLYQLQSLLETAPDPTQPITLTRTYEHTIISYDDGNGGARLLCSNKHYAEWKKIMPNPECTINEIHIQLSEYERLKLEQTLRLFLMFKANSAEQYVRINFSETMELEVIESIPCKTGTYHSQSSYIGVGTGNARHNQKEWDEMFPTLDPYTYSNTFKLKLFHEAICSSPSGDIELHGHSTTGSQSPLYIMQNHQIQHAIMPCRM